MGTPCNWLAPHVKTQADAIVEALKPFFPKVKYEVQTARMADHLQISVSITSDRNNGSLSYTTKLDTPQAITGLMAELTAAQNDKATTQSMAVEVRRNLARLPMAERQIKGQLAKHRLQSTQEGQDILASLDAMVMPTTLMSLPAPDKGKGK